MLYIVEQLFNILSVLLLSFILCVKSDLSSSRKLDVEITYRRSHPVLQVTVEQNIHDKSYSILKSCKITLKNSTSVSMKQMNLQSFYTAIGDLCDWNRATVKCSLYDKSQIIKNISLDNNIKPTIVMDETVMLLNERRNVTATFYNFNLRSTKMNCYVRTSSYYTKLLQNLNEKIVLDQRCGYFNITKVFAFQAEQKWSRSDIYCMDRRHGHPLYLDLNINFESNLKVPLIIWKARSTLSVSNNRTVEGQFVIVTVTSEDGTLRAEHSCTLRGSDGDEILTARSTPGDIPSFEHFGIDHMYQRKSTEFWFTAHRFYSEIICVIKQGNFSQLTETLKQTLSVKVLSAGNKQSHITGLVISNIMYGVILVFVFVLLGIGFYKKILVLQLSKEHKVEIKEDKITLIKLMESETD